MELFTSSLRSATTRAACTQPICSAEATGSGTRSRTKRSATSPNLPEHAIDVVRRFLRGEAFVPLHERLEIIASKPQGRCGRGSTRDAAARLRIAAELTPVPRGRSRDGHGSRQGRGAAYQAGHDALVAHPHARPSDLGLTDADEDDLYDALAWLLDRQEIIERKLAARHLTSGGIALYDLSSSYFEGKTCPLAALGYSRDGRRGTLHEPAPAQAGVNYGLLTDSPSRQGLGGAHQRAGLGRVPLSASARRVAAARPADIAATGPASPQDLQAPRPPET